MTASAREEVANPLECLRFLQAVEQAKSANIVLDDEHQIRSHYERKLQNIQTFGLRWFNFMLTHGRVVQVRRSDVNKNIKTQLQKVRFPLKNEDYKYYVRTAAASSDGLLVSHDDDYRPEVKAILRRIPVHVISTADGEEKLI